MRRGLTAASSMRSLGSLHRRRLAASLSEHRRLSSSFSISDVTHPSLVKSSSASDPLELCPYALARGIRSRGIERAVWAEIRLEAKAQNREQSWRSLDLQEFGIDDYLGREVLDHRSLACGLTAGLGAKLCASRKIHGEPERKGIDFEKIILSALKADPQITTSVATDILRFKEVDPACPGLLGVFLFYKGVHALACARVAHHYWTRRGEAGKLIARLMQSETSDVFGVDIHPGAKLGDGITIDHATGVVVGETSVLGNNVYLMHDVTLGSTGTTDTFDRHPKIADGVFLGAKCTVLGNVVIGEGATVAAAALVNKPVPPGYTAVGVPAKLLPPPKGSKYWKPDLSSVAKRVDVTKL